MTGRVEVKKRAQEVRIIYKCDLHFLNHREPVFLLSFKRWIVMIPFPYWKNIFTSFSPPTRSVTYTVLAAMSTITFGFSQIDGKIHLSRLHYDCYPKDLCHNSIWPTRQQSYDMFIIRNWRCRKEGNDNVNQTSPLPSWKLQPGQEFRHVNSKL